MEAREGIVLFLVGILGFFSMACGGGGSGGNVVTAPSPTNGAGAIVNGKISGEGSLANIPVFLIAKGQTPLMTRVSGSPRSDIAGSYYSTLTDGTGNFAFLDIAEGVYNVIAQADSFRSAVKYDLTVNRANTITISLTLTATGEISGTVGVPLGANPLGIIAFVAGTSYGAFTDSSGGFKITGIPVGTYTLSFSGQGFAFRTLTAVNVGAGKTTAIGNVPLTLGNTAFGVSLSGPDRLKGGFGAAFQAAIQGTAVGPFSFLWTASSGTLLNPDSSTTQWTAPTGFVGLVRLRCRVTDATGASSTGSLDVDVLSTANFAPIVGIQGPVVVQVGSSVRYLANADDPEGDTLTFAWQPNSGVFWSPAASETAWTAPTAAGPQTVRCQVTDSHGAVSFAQINLQVVQSSNLPPTVTILGPTVVGAASPARFIAIANDPENTPMLFQWTADSGVLASPTSHQTDWTPPSSSGPVKISCKVTDSGGSATTASLTVQVKASNPDRIEWQCCLGGTGADLARSICPAPGGDGFVVMGQTVSNTDDFAGTAKGGSDIFVAKYSFSGNRQWLKRYGGTGNELGSLIIPTPSGGYTVVGSTNSGGSGDVSIALGGSDVWVVQLDGSGNILWEKSLGTSISEYGYGIVPCGEEVFVSSWNEIQGAGCQICFHRLASDGRLLAQGQPNTGDHHDTSPVEEIARKMTIDSSNRITFADYHTFRNELYRYRYDLTSAGFYSNDFHCRGIINSMDGNLLLFGANGGYTDGALQELCIDNGGTIWQTTIGESGTDVFNDAAQTLDGCTLAAGEACLSTTNGGQDFWLANFTPNGTLKWQCSVGGSGKDVAWGVIATPDGGSVLAGTTLSNDGCVSGNHGAEDVWIVKLGY